MGSIIVTAFIVLSIIGIFIYDRIDNKKYEKLRKERQKQNELDSFIPSAEDARELASMYRDKELKIAFEYINRKINKAIRAGKTEINLEHCDAMIIDGISYSNANEILSELSSKKEIDEYYSGYRVIYQLTENPYKPKIKTISWRNS